MMILQLSHSGQLKINEEIKLFSAWFVSFVRINWQITNHLKTWKKISIFIDLHTPICNKIFFCSLLLHNDTTTESFWAIKNEWWNLNFSLLDLYFFVRIIWQLTNHLKFGGIIHELSCHFSFQLLHINTGDIIIPFINDEILF